MTYVILALSAAYAVIAVLLVVILFSTRVSVLVRALATVLVVPLIFVTYWGIGEIRGLPTDTRPPALFRMHWARIVEPDKLSGDKGAIYLWIEELDEDNYPNGLPRAYKLRYTRKLAEAVENALAAISGGEEVAGQIEEDVAELETSERLAEEIANEGQGDANAVIGERVLKFDFGDIRFGALPAPVTPDKE